MASNQTNRFQSLDSSVEEFRDWQENENTKKKTKHDVALFHEFLVLVYKMYVFQILNFRRTFSTYFQDVSN